MSAFNIFSIRPIVASNPGMDAMSPASMSPLSMASSFEGPPGLDNSLPDVSPEIGESITVSSAISEGEESPRKKLKAEEGPALTNPEASASQSQEGPPTKIIVLTLRGKADDVNRILSTPPKASVIEPERKVRRPSKRKAQNGKYHVSAQSDKPEPYGQPSVWSDRRQSLCESLPYYKAYMSGGYQQVGTVSGFLVDKEVGPRDKFLEEVIVTSVGGGRSLDEESGRMIQKKDQDKSGIGLAFKRAKEIQRPIVVIAGQGNQISPSKLPHYYNVLDWFHVTDVWCEKIRGLRVWMVRLEKINLHEKSWWATVDSPLPDPSRDITSVKTKYIQCKTCAKYSKEIFNAGWACLETSCDSYFQFPTPVDDSTLDYSEEFLKERTSYVGEIPGPLAPALPTSEEMDRNGEFGVEKSFKDGIVCPQCHGCSRRVEWTRWACETEGCTFTYNIPQRIVSVQEAVSESILHLEDSHKPHPGIRIGQDILGQYDVYEYIMPGLQKEVAGYIRVYRSNGVINTQPDGPNDLFRQMQVNDFGLKRNPARLKGSTGEMLTSHWASNWGAPYKYGVTVLSKGFSEAPEVIIKALKRLTWAGQHTLSERHEEFQPFNEVLTLGYFEDSTIGYHDDGEKELGPTVATLSLGASAVMSFRPKAKVNIGPESKNAKGTKRDALRLVLLHGDILVMHGRDIQKYYEHAVTPHGKLRFALTCRYIRPELLANDEERKQAAIKSKLPDGHERFDYDGDVGKTVPYVSKETSDRAKMRKSMAEIEGWATAGGLDREEFSAWYTGVIDKINSS